MSIAKRMTQQRAIRKRNLLERLVFQLIQLLLSQHVVCASRLHQYGCALPAAYTGKTEPGGLDPLRHVEQLLLLEKRCNRLKLAAERLLRALRTV